MNWPSLRAAPRIRPSVATRRRIFASLMKTLPPDGVPPAVRRNPSEAAPQLIDAANAAREHLVQVEVSKPLTTVVEQSAYTG